MCDTHTQDHAHRHTNLMKAEVSLNGLTIAKHMELCLRSNKEQAMKGTIDMPSHLLPEVIPANFSILFIIHACLFTNDNDLL